MSAEPEVPEAIIEWLGQQGFPYDWHSTTPAPACLLRPLAEWWAATDGSNHDVYEETMQYEQQFVSGEATR